MNIHARTIKSQSINRKKTASGSMSWTTMGFVFYFLLLCGIFFLITTHRISLSQKIADADKDAERITHQLALYDREIENLKLKKEKLSSWPHIRERIQKFRLALRVPDPFQVQHLTLIYNNSGKEISMIGGGEQKAAMLSRP